MVYFDGFFGLVLIGLWIFCFIDVLLTPSPRNLPKLAWVSIVLLLPTIGSIAWLVAGHQWTARSGDPASLRSSARWSDGAAQPVPARRSGAVAPDDDEDFLAGLRARAEEQRRRARETKPPERDDRAES